MISFLRYWLPLFVWMAVIFGASADSQSVQHTSRFLEPFLRWIKPDITPETIDTIRWMIRKAAHLTEYAVLAQLWWRALRGADRSAGWSWRQAALALLLCAIYAATDEFHQSFVKGRTASAGDVLIDTAGAALGLAVLRGVMAGWVRRRG